MNDDSAQKPFPNSESMFVRFAARMPGIICELAPDGTTVFVNDAVAKIVGYGPDELRNKNWWDIFFPGQQRHQVDELYKRIQAGEVTDYEMTMTAKDGSLKTLRWISSASYLPDGGLESIICFGVDITERKRVEEELHNAIEQSQQYEEDFSTLLHSFREALEYREFKDAAGAIFESSKTLTGAGAGFVSLLTDEEAEEDVFMDTGGLPCEVERTLRMPTRRLRAEVQRTGNAIFHNHFARTEGAKALPKGHMTIDNVLLAPLVINGKVVGLLGLANKPGGFTERDVRVASAFGELAAVALNNSRSLESLEHSEARFRSVAQTASDGIIVIDSQGTVVFWNRAAERLFGCSADEIIGQPLTSIMPERFREAHRAGLKRVVSTGEPRIIGKTVEMAGLRKDGTEFPVELSLATWRTKEGLFFTGIVRDITVRKLAEADRSRLIAIVEATSDFVATATPDERVLYINEAGRRLLGIGKDEDITDLRVRDTHPDWMYAIIRQEAIPTAMRTGTWEGETVLVTREGRGIPVSQVILAHRGTDGTVEYLSTVARDISDRKRLEDVLRKARDELEMRVAERTAELARANEALKDEIEARARADEERLRLANYWRLLLESTDEGIYGLDLRGRCTLLNRAAAEMVGWEPEQIVGKNMHQFIHHSRADGSPYPAEECRVCDAYRTRQGIRAENEVFWRKDGTSFQVEYSSSPIIEDGDLKGAVVIFKDITNRKQAEEERERLTAEARRTAAELDATITSIAEGVLVYSPTGEIVRMNPTAERILGYTPERLKLPIAERIRLLNIETPEGEPFSIDESPPIRALRGEAVHSVPMAIHPAPDITTWISVSAAPIFTDDSEPLGVVAVFTDITELHELTEVAQRRSAELQGIIDNMVDGVFVCNSKGEITLVNESGRRLLGIAGPEEARLALVELPQKLQARHLDGRSIAREEMPLVRALAGEVVTDMDEMFFNSQVNRDVYVRTNAAPIRDESGEIVGAVGVARDVTELTELDRLKDQFISVAAHELKTPVTIMKGYAQSLRRAAEEVSSQQRKMLDAIDRGSDRITAIVDDLLRISRLQLGQLEMRPERINLPELVEEIADRMAITTTKHRLRVVKTEPAVVQGDWDRLEQVLLNLVDNAIRYSPMGGDIDIAVEERDNQAVVSVRDHGIGIPKHKQARIFQRFYRAHTGTPYDYGGMGVGLYISSEIVRRHGGRMWFQSEEGKGSTFNFSLPLA